MNAEYGVARFPKNLIHMATAKLWSLQSTCLRLHVGAVIVKGGRTVSTGYNGAPSGFPHCNSHNCSEERSCKRTVHAEMNAIAFAARYGISTQGAELYTTHAPCIDCAKAIVNAGIKRVLYESEYRSKEGIILLTQAGLDVEMLKVPKGVYNTWLENE